MVIEKIDPYKSKEKYLNWKKITEQSDLIESNYNILMRYLSDMEKGLNVSANHKKGSRSYARLNTIRIKIAFFMREFQKIFNLEKITDIKEEQIHDYFLNMRNGEIKRRDGQNFKCVSDYVKDFKTFWHWWQKVNKKQGIEIPDITVDIDKSDKKPAWVYLTEEQIKELAESAKYDYKVLILFLFDSGVHAPTELINIRVSDLYHDCKELNVRQETSKTFGRRIKLMICSEILKEYIKNKGLKANDQVFDICPPVCNRYIKRLSLKLFGDIESPAGAKYSELTMYDFRHCSCCYWLPRYKSESALKYRFGWKKSDEIHYYSELLGMKDTIAEEDLLIDTTKTEIEKRLDHSEKEKEVLKDKVKVMESQMHQIMNLVNGLIREAKNDSNFSRQLMIEKKSI